MPVVRNTMLRSALTMRGRAVRATVLPTRRVFRSSSSTSDKFRFQQHAWENYLNTGEGSNELFVSFLTENNNKEDVSLESSTVRAEQLCEFLQCQPKEVGVGEAELAELQSMKHRELHLRDFRAWIRHATHDWNVHV